MPGASHIVYSGKGDTRYASVMRSIRTGRDTHKQQVHYLGRVLDAERGIYKNKERGVFVFDLKTMTFSAAPADFVDTTKRQNAREELIVDFGDAFLFDQLIKRYNLSPAIEAIGYGNPDSLHALLLYYMLSSRSNQHALTWLEGSYARILYPKANLTSQRISDLLAEIGREDTMQRFFQAYLPLLGSDVREGANILIDSTGLPNSIHFPLTAVCNHNGIISEEIRLIYVVQQGSRLPIYMRYVSGNIVDASTLVTTVKELKAVGVNTKFAILDAGYLTEEGMKELTGEKISFITRCPSNRRIYKDLISVHMDGLVASENLALDSNGRLFNGRRVYVKCVPVKGYMGMDLYAYIGKDMTTASLEDKQYAHRIHGSGEKVDRTAFHDELIQHGVFMLLSTRRVRAEELLSTYYVRQEIEQVFDIAKNYASLLPLFIEKEETLRGHLLLTFIAIAVLQTLQLEIRASKYSIDAVLSNMANQHAKIFQRVVIPSEPTKVQNDIYQTPEGSPRKGIPPRWKLLGGTMCGKKIYPGTQDYGARAGTAGRHFTSQVCPFRACAALPCVRCAHVHESARGRYLCGG